MDLRSNWNLAAGAFLRSLQTPNGAGASSVPGGPVTLYGTCYSILALDYLGEPFPISETLSQFITGYQDPRSGLFIGPELVNFEPHQDVLHDRTHLVLHQTSAVLSFIQQYGIVPSFPIRGAHEFCDVNYLRDWLAERDFTTAWFEGNNLFFVGQLLVYLRDVEKHPAAAAALQLWFGWLDDFADPETGLWGTDGHCSKMEAVYGGYHQLLVYFHETHGIPNAQGTVDTVLSLQHLDGGFNPNGNAGACEDVDSVDILVNCYKRFDYRRADIRRALRRCLRHILSTQNTDGGFPYNRDQPQSHMGIPGTAAEPNVSCTFPTWFRIHTLALIAEVLPQAPEVKGIPFRFNRALSMGWHASPACWQPVADSISLRERLVGAGHAWFKTMQISARGYRFVRRTADRILRGAGLRP
jgi:hypothetical protein